MSYWANRKVLVTGGAGFIGSHLVPRLLEMGAFVRVADDLSRGRRENLGDCLDCVEFLQADLTEGEACRRACAGMEVVVHLAARVGGIDLYRQRPGEVMAHNLLLDTLMWQAAQAAAVERYLYASSAHVYPLERQGQPEAPPLREEQALPAHPPISYGWAKLAGEQLLQYAVSQGASTGVAILRLQGVYGPHQDMDLERASAIAAFMRQAVEWPQRRFRLLGSGQETRSYCYVSDVVDAMLLALEQLHNQRLVGPLNIGSEQRVRIGDLAKMIIEISGKPIELEYDLAHETIIWGQAVDCSRAHDSLGWWPRVSLREGLARTYAFVQERLAAEQVTAG